MRIGLNFLLVPFGSMAVGWMLYEDEDDNVCVDILAAFFVLSLRFCNLEERQDG